MAGTAPSVGQRTSVYLFENGLSAFMVDDAAVRGRKMFNFAHFDFAHEAADCCCNTTPTIWPWCLASAAGWNWVRESQNPHLKRKERV